MSDEVSTIGTAKATATALPQALSITHQHMLACMNTLVCSSEAGRPLRVLDVGCGNGELIAYLLASFLVLNPRSELEIFGLDVADSGVQAAGFFARTSTMLSKRFPNVNWQERLSLVTSRETWSYPEDYFDFIVSNQVLEHVSDHDLLFQEIRRTLKPGGFSAHLFPLAHYIQEGHIHIPLAHRINGHGLLRSYIRFMSLVGFGSYREHQRQFGMTIDEYAEEHADYLTFMTNYLTSKQLLKIAKRNGLRADFRFTSGFYTAKVRAMLHRRPIYQYHAPHPLRDAFSFQFFKRISSITLVLEKKQSYAR